MSLFCSNQCEQAEDRVQGVGILVVSMNWQIVVLCFMTSGPYKGLWSVFHNAKPAQDLARDTCVRLAREDASSAIAPTSTDPYIMVEHSTPNVFSYTVVAMRDHLPSILPPTSEINGQRGLFAHVRLEQFRQPLTRDNISVMDINHKQRKVSRHTQKVILEILSGVVGR